MNTKIVTLTFSLLTASVMYAWSEPQKPCFASQKSEYKSKKLERRIGLALFPENEETLSMAEKCYNNWENCEQCKIFRRLIQQTALKLPTDKNVYSLEDFQKAFAQTPNNKRELALIVKGQLKDLEEEVSDKEVKEYLASLYEATYGQKLNEEMKNVFAAEFNKKLTENCIAAKAKFKTNQKES